MIASVPRRRRSPLHDGSLFRPQTPGVLGVRRDRDRTGIVSFGQQSFFRQISPAGWALSWALLAVYALPVLFLVYVLDLYEREPLSLVFGALLWGAVAATTLSGFANDGWGLVVCPGRRPGVRGALDGCAHRPVRRGDPQGSGCGADLPDRSRRVRRHDGRLRLRRGVRPGVRGRRGRLLLHGRVRRSSERRAAGLLRPCRGQRALFARPVHGTRRDGHRVLRVPTHIAVRSRGGSIVLAGLSAAAVLGHFLWNSPLLDLFPSQPWSGVDLPMIPVATAVKGLPLLAFATLAVVLARRRERTWLRGALAEEIGGPGVSAAELATLEDSERAAPGGPRHADARRGPRGRAAPPPPAGTGEPGDDPLQGRDRRRPGVDRAARVLRIAPRRAPCDPGRGPRRRRWSAADAGPRDR